MDGEDGKEIEAYANDLLFEFTKSELIQLLENNCTIEQLDEFYLKYRLMYDGINLISKDAVTSYFHPELFDDNGNHL